MYNVSLPDNGGDHAFGRDGDLVGDGTGNGCSGDPDKDTDSIRNCDCGTGGDLFRDLDGDPFGDNNPVGAGDLDVDNNFC